MHKLNLNPENSHDVILDIIYRIKIRDIMTSDLFTVSPDSTMADAKKIMKDKKVTGLPVAREKRLLGIVSIHDILICLDNEDLSANVKNYMSKNLIVLEEDMPLSFALSYFEKYKYHRFPVLDRQKMLSGMVTGRDINVTLLNEINRALKKIDSHNQTEESDIARGKYFRQFRTRKYDFENAGKTSIAIKKLLREIGFPGEIVRRVSIAVYELEINQVVHSDGGIIRLYIEGNEITIEAKDSGPGIAELDRAVEEGYSTASDWIRGQGFGAGMGLPNVKKVSDDFQISSDPEKGTDVTVKIYSGGSDENI